MNMPESAPEGIDPEERLKLWVRILQLVPLRARVHGDERQYWRDAGRADLIAGQNAFQFTDALPAV